jgi:hypothetical protein
MPIGRGDPVCRLTTSHLAWTTPELQFTDVLQRRERGQPQVGTGQPQLPERNCKERHGDSDQAEQRRPACDEQPPLPLPLEHRILRPGMCPGAV